MSLRRRATLVVICLVVILAGFLITGFFSFRAAKSLGGQAEQGVEQHLLLLGQLQRMEQMQSQITQLNQISKERLLFFREPHMDPALQLKLDSSLFLLYDLLEALPSTETQLTHPQIWVDSLRSLLIRELPQQLDSLSKRRETLWNERNRIRHTLRLLAHEGERKAGANLKGHESLYALQMAEAYALPLLTAPSAGLHKEQELTHFQHFRNRVQHAFAQAPPTLRPNLKTLYSLLQTDLPRYTQDYTQFQRHEELTLFRLNHLFNTTVDSIEARLDYNSRHLHIGLNESNQAMRSSLYKLSARMSNSYFLHFLLASAALILCLGALWGLYHYIAQPILALAQLAHKISDGHYNAAPPSTRQDEVGTLERSMYEMSHRVAASQHSLQAAVQRLEKQKEELEQFSYTLAHDLRSPLITISAFSTELRHDLAANDLESVHQDLDLIHASTQRMGDLMDHVLTLTRLGKSFAPLADQSMDTILDDAIANLEGMCRQRNAQILRPAHALPLIWGDPLRLRQLWQNLLENGIKYTPMEQNPQLQIGYEFSDNLHHFWLQDHGIGIDPTYLDKVFGLFDKLDRQSPGTGVGLALARRIIDLHGGSIWAESLGIGHGTTLHFTFPIHKNQAHT